MTSSAWVLGSMVLCGLSAVFLSWFCSDSWLIGLIAGIAVLAVLVTLQGMVVTGTGPDCAQPTKDQAQWRPSAIRVAIFVSIALLFSQPILIFLYSKVYGADVVAQMQSEASLRAELMKNQRLQEQNELQSQLAALTEVLNQHLSGTKPVSTRQKPASKPDIPVLPRPDSIRKALLIGNQSYPTAPLHNPVKDTRDLAKALSGIGFSVTVLTDLNRRDMELALDSYIRTIKPGDISVLYFSGHGFQFRGNNYLVPVDFKGFGDSNTPNALGVNLAIESISIKLPQANIIVIDACRTFALGSSGGLAATEAGRNTYIALAAKPGQSAQDGEPGTNGFFTAALLKQVTRPVDIDRIFRDVRKDVADKSHFTQETWTAHNLSNELILASAETALATKERQSDTGDVARFTPVSPLSSCEAVSASVPNEMRFTWVEECLKAGILRIQDEITDRGARSGNPAEGKPPANGIQTTGHSSTELHFLFRQIWSHPYYAFLATIFFVLLLSGGYLWRDFFSEGLLSYERLRHADQRAFLRDRFMATRDVANALPYAPPRELTNAVNPFRDEVVPVLQSFQSSDEVFSFWEAQPTTAFS